MGGSKNELCAHSLGVLNLLLIFELLQVCGVTNPKDAQEAAKAGANFIGEDGR